MQGSQSINYSSTQNYITLRALIPRVRPKARVPYIKPKSSTILKPIPIEGFIRFAKKAIITSTAALCAIAALKSASITRQVEKSLTQSVHLPALPEIFVKSKPKVVGIINDIKPLRKIIGDKDTFECLQEAVPNMKLLIESTDGTIDEIAAAMSQIKQESDFRNLAPDKDKACGFAQVRPYVEFEVNKKFSTNLDRFKTPDNLKIRTLRMKSFETELKQLKKSSHKRDSELAGIQFKEITQADRYACYNAGFTAWFTHAHGIAAITDIKGEIRFISGKYTITKNSIKKSGKRETSLVEWTSKKGKRCSATIKTGEKIINPEMETVRDTGYTITKKYVQDCEKRRQLIIKYWDKIFVTQ